MPGAGRSRRTPVSAPEQVRPSLWPLARRGGPALHLLRHTDGALSVEISCGYVLARLAVRMLAMQSHDSQKLANIAPRRLLWWSLLAFARGAVAPTTLHCDALSAASHSPSFCASVWTTGLAGPRKIVVTPAGTVLVLDTPALGGDDGRVLAVWDADNDGYSDESERATLLDRIPGLGQGIAVRGGFIYASTGASVRRWPYADGTRSAVRPVRRFSLS